jgi:hypothetical protein
VFDLKTEPTTYEEIVARARYVRAKLGITQAPQPVTIQECPPPKPKPVQVIPQPEQTPLPGGLSPKAKEIMNDPAMAKFLQLYYGGKDPLKSVSRFIENIEHWIKVQQLPRPAWVAQEIRDFCREHDIPAIVIFADCRIGRIMELRHRLWARIHANERKPYYAQIGRWFGRDHTSVLYGINRDQYGPQSPRAIRKKQQSQQRRKRSREERREALKASIQAWDASKWS